MTSAEFRGIRRPDGNCATIEHLADCNKDSILIEPFYFHTGVHVTSISELINWISFVWLNTNSLSEFYQPLNIQLDFIGLQVI